MGNGIKIDKCEKKRDQWVEAFDEDQICRLASSFHHGDPCTIFQPRKRGSFNLCFFVQFDSPIERWVVRVPIPACLPRGLLDEKLEIEVATMRYVSAKTSIPVPKVHAYAFSDTGVNGLPFIIMDYVDGRSLKDLGFGSGETWRHLHLQEAQTPAAKRVHRHLADVYIQLRQLEFPQIGALGLPSRHVSALSCAPEEIQVRHRPLSIEIATQELDGLEPGAIFPPNKAFSTARDYAEALLRLADNALENEADQGMEDNEPASILYAAHHFKHFIRNEWLVQSANEGPFVLAHGDLEGVVHNLLFDDDHNLVGVVDWEWSRVVPAQLLVPPIWLLAGSLEWVLFWQDAYNRQVRHLLTAVREREEALSLAPLLSRDWAPLETWCHTAVAIALTCPERAYKVYWHLVFRKEVPKIRHATAEQQEEERNTVIVPRIRAFIEASEKRQAFLEKKIREQTQYYEAEKEYFGDKWARQVTDRFYCYLFD